MKILKSQVSLSYLELALALMEAFSLRIKAAIKQTAKENPLRLFVL